VVFVLEGARDKRWASAGAGLFPEILKAELHAVRSVIEAYSKSGQIVGIEDGSASGILLAKGAPWNHVFRVTSGAGTAVEYKLDRWD
jgi:hypothetical protein